MKKKVKSFVLKLDAPVTVDEGKACTEIILSGLNRHFDEDGHQLFRPEALILVRNAFAKLAKRRKRKTGKK